MKGSKLLLNMLQGVEKKRFQNEILLPFFCKGSVDMMNVFKGDSST
jgi:hypothetical protein